MWSRNFGNKVEMDVLKSWDQDGGVDQTFLDRILLILRNTINSSNRYAYVFYSVMCEFTREYIREETRRGRLYVQQDAAEGGLLAVCRVFWLFVQHQAAEERSACSLQSAECSDCLYNTMLQRKGLLAVCNLQSVLAVHTTTCCRGKVCLQSAVCRVFWLYVQHHAAEERSACSLQSAVFWLYGCTHHVRTELNKFCGAILLISKNSLLTYSK